MSKHHAFLLVGPTIPSGDELHDVLLREQAVLAEAALTTPDVTQADLFRSSVELFRTHKAEGLKRKDVEGAWTRIVRRAEKTKAAVLFGHDSYAAADAGQRSLMLDALSGFRTHVVITAERGRPGLDDLIDGWATDLKPSRLHVVTLEEGEGLDVLLPRLVDLARETRETDLEKRIVKLKKKRSELKEQLEEIRSA